CVVSAQVELRRAPELPIALGRERSARPGSGRAGSRLPRQAGFTLAEVMVAMTLLLVGILGTVKMIEAGSAAQSVSRGREAATNIARELLEDAHQTTYSTI